MYLTTELIHALPASERRVYNRDEAASYVGVSPGFFESLVAGGKMPSALPMGRIRRWDKVALDRALDVLGGVDRSAESVPPSPYEAWSRRRGQG
jgi:excisionase family DNA binding protein